MARKRRNYKLLEYTSVKAGLCKLRSGWEREYLEWLDNNPDAVTVEYEKLYILYTSNLRTKRQRRYYPDFVVTWSDGRTEIIEVKPFKRITGQIVRKKAAAAKAWAAQNGMTYKFMTEKDLKPLGLLVRPKRASSRKLAAS